MMITGKEAPFTAGDLVTTDWDWRTEGVVYRVDRCYPSRGHSQTGWTVTATATDPKARTQTLSGLDSAWFQRVES